ncbi:MAG: hypothetical protein WKF90_00020 [Pyrinomonadaceae bacterium]
MPVREDDLSIADEDLLWRRIQNIPQWLKINSDGTFRLSSAAFLDDYTGEVSVHLEKIILSQEKVLAGKPDDGLVEIEAGFPRSLSHKITHDPTNDDPSHALICPPEISNNRRRTDAKKMAKIARWLIHPKLVRN